CLERVHARGIAWSLRDMFRLLPVFAEPPYVSRKGSVVGDQGTGVAHGTKVLGRVEAERCGITGAAGAKSLATRSMGLAGILEHLQAASLSAGTKAPHVGHLTVEVHGKKHPG